MKPVIVVGGGISGILSALLLRKKGKNVVLVEREPKLGGLLSSELSPEGDSFDYGTHYLVSTGHPEIDALLFPDEWSRDWIPLPFLKAGNYFQGRLNEHCMFVDTNLLPVETYQRGCKELLGIRTEAQDPRNLEEFLNHTFGRTFAKEVFEPLVSARLGMPLAELYANSNALIGLTRILVADPETTRKLKTESRAYDSKIGFHSYLEGKRPTMSYYPKSGGTRVWIDLLEARLLEAGVRVLKDATVKSIEHGSDKVSAALLNDGSRIECEALFWTLPISGFLKCCGMRSMIEPPKIRVTSHFNYVFNRPAPTDLYYFLCNDATKLSYRVTLYSNVQRDLAKQTGRYCATVEVLSGPLEDVDAASNRIFGELIDMGAAASGSNVVWKSARSGVSGIPIITPKFVEQTAQQLSALEGRLSNAYFSGMVPGVSFFKKEVLIQSFEQIARIP